MSKQYSRPAITGRAARAVPRSDGLIEYRDFSNGLLCLFDPDRRKIYIQRGREKNQIDLTPVLDKKSEDMVQ